MLDWLGCAIGGAATSEAAFIKEHIVEMGGNGQAGVFGLSGLTSVFNAALGNGYAGHVLEFDDVDQDSITHPATVVIPGALALGEWRGVGGEDLLAAIVAGYEVMLRIGAAVAPSHYRLWHATATTGVFGSAVSAGRILGLDAVRMGGALGSAGTMSAGLWEFLRDGAMGSKCLHAGKAAANGVLAALLAQRGLTGARRILEGAQGFFAAYARQDVNLSLFSDLGIRYRIDGIAFKPWPCCRHTHAAVDAALRLRDCLDEARTTVQRVRLSVAPAALQVANIADPADGRQAQFSLSYCFARALLSGSLVLESFSPEQLFDPAVRSLMARIEIEPDTAAEEGAQGRRAQARAVLSDGRTQDVQIPFPKGDMENPMTNDEIDEKFFKLTKKIIGERKSTNAIKICRNIEKITNCSDLMKEVVCHE